MNTASTTQIVANASQVSTPIGVLAVVITAVAFVGIGWLWRATAPTRLTPGPTSLGLGDERPAIVDLLTGGFTTEADAVPATVIDLANRGYYTIEKYGGRTVLRLRQHVNDQRPLAAYEQRVLQHIGRNAVDGVTPAEVLTLGEHGVSQRWLQAFGREVTADARAQGLCERRWGFRHMAIVWGLVAVAFIGPMIAYSRAPRVDSPFGWGSPGNVLAGVAMIGAAAAAMLARRVTTGDAQVDTATGREAATRWLGVREYYRSSGNFRGKEAASVAIWDEHLAYATAMGLARQVERELPFEPESDTRAWSDVTGEWRKVKIAYWSPLPFWGQSPGRVVFSGLLQGAIAAFVAYLAFQLSSGDSRLVAETLTLGEDRQQTISLVTMIVAIAAGAVVAYCATKTVIGVADLFRRRTVEGLVLRLRSYATGLDKYSERVEERYRLPFRISFGNGHHDHGRRRTQRNRFVAIDDGSRDRIRALQLDERRFSGFVQGATVRVKVSPLLGYVSDVTLLSVPEHRRNADPSANQELIANAAKAASGRLGGLFSRVSELLEDGGIERLRQQATGQPPGDIATGDSSESERPDS